MYCAYVQRTSLAVGSVSVSVSLILETLWRALKRLPPRNGLHHHPPPYPLFDPLPATAPLYKIAISFHLCYAFYCQVHRFRASAWLDTPRVYKHDSARRHDFKHWRRWRLHLWCYQHRAARCENRRRIPQRPQHYQRPQSVSNTTYTSFGGKLKLRSISFQTSTQSLNLN